MALRPKARLALNVIGDAVDRVLYPKLYGTPQEHLDRIDELLARKPKPAHDDQPDGA